MRKAALALPNVVEGTSYGTPAFRVGKTLFARFWDDGETLVLKVDMMERDILLESEPEIFFLTDHYRGYPMILARLPKVEPARLAALLRSAHAAVLKRPPTTAGR